MTGPGKQDNNDNPGGAGYSEKDKDDGGKHHTLYNPDRNDHISWDSDRNGDYVPGSGHERENGETVNDWDRK